MSRILSKFLPGHEKGHRLEYCHINCEVCGMGGVNVQIVAPAGITQVRERKNKLQKPKAGALCKRYTISKYAADGNSIDTMFTYESLLLEPDKLELTILPGIHSSLLISVMWVTCVIFITIMFTYVYATLHEVWLD